MYVCGLGTGRCGTKSLAKLLSLQEGWQVTHENEPHLSWSDEPDPGQSFRRAAYPNYSDVAFYYLPHVNRLRELYPGMRFVCMQRDCEATVASFVRKQPPGIHWFSDSQQGWCRSFPAIDAPGIEEQARLYWHLYYEWARQLEGDDFRIFPTTALGDPAGTLEILQFCGVTEPRNLPCHVR
jgi:hypothetical protein